MAGAVVVVTVVDEVVAGAAKAVKGGAMEREMLTSAGSDVAA